MESFRQTVWLEHVPKNHIKNFRFYPDIRNGRLLFEVYAVGAEELSISASYQGNSMGNARLCSDTEVFRGELQLAETHLWELGNGRLYDVEFCYGEDKVKSYFGLREIRTDVLPGYLNQWREVIERDFNHPAIIGWCPFNETWDYQGKRQWDELISAVYYMTKALDSTRPCIDTSGNYHVVTDIFDVHDYDQNPETFAKRF